MLISVKILFLEATLWAEKIWLELKLVIIARKPTLLEAFGDLPPQVLTSRGKYK